MESANIKKEYGKWVLILDEQGVRRLYNEILDRLNEHGDGAVVKFFLRYSDGSSFETDNIDQVIGDENARGRRIREIEILGANGERGRENYKEIKLEFGRTTGQYKPDVYLNVTGSRRQWIFVTQSIIEDRLRSFRQSSLRIGYLVFATLILGFIILLLLLPYIKEYLPLIMVPKDNGTSSELGGGFFILFFIYASFTIGVIYIFNKLFLNLTFLFGKELERHADRLRRRSELFWGVGIAFLLSIIAGVFFKIVFSS